MFRAGAFSSDPDRAVARATATRCAASMPRRWRGTSRSTPAIPLVGLDGRAALLRRLGAALAAASRPVRRECRAARPSRRSCSGAAAGRVASRADILAAAARRLVADLAVRAGAQRRPDRRRRPPSRRSHRRRDRRHRAVPQAVAVAHLFAARADRGRRASRWPSSTSSPRCRNIATAACWSISA